jgi:uncharacterized protein YdbL (DUF1318 family)
MTTIWQSGRRSSWQQPFSRRACLTAIGAAILLSAVPMPLSLVMAQSLDELRASGTVGERFDGYAVVRDAGAAASVKAMVNDINAKRRAIYEERAKAQGVPSEQVGRVYAEQILQKAPSGTWILSADGKWVQK